MESFKEYLNEGKDRGNNKVQAMSDIVSALKTSLNGYDILTRRFVWERLNNEKGKELMEKLLRNPKTYLSDSEFRKLVQTK